MERKVNTKKKAVKKPVAKRTAAKNMPSKKTGKSGARAQQKKNLPPTVRTPPDILDEVRLLEVLSAVRKGSFSERMPSGWTGLAGKIADTLNDIIDNNQEFSKQIHKVNAEIGRNGKTNVRLDPGPAKSTWTDSVKSINNLLELTLTPLIEVGHVVAAISRGDLTHSIDPGPRGLKLKGEFLQIARNVNNMTGKLAKFSEEVIRVAREVGVEGNLGGQAKVKGLEGTWKDLADNVNLMAGNLTEQVRNIADVTTAVANGDLSKKITVDVKGEILELKTVINSMVERLNSFAEEVTTMAREVGTEGKLGGQARVKGVSGIWKDLTDNVNFMASNLTRQVRNIAEVTTAVAEGNLTKKITVDAQGEILDLKNTINTMVEQLNSFSTQVTNVAREVGIEGKLGGQAKVQGVAGTWKDLTENVNTLAMNLTDQVRNIAEVTTAVAEGDLSKKITVDAQGEVLQVKNTVNAMVDQLNSFSGEVIRVSREVGNEGVLGGQADVKGVTGVWKDLTTNVNRMTNNLTGQVRNIAEVTTAVARGDLTRKITVEAKGEILKLKETINTMVDQLNSFSTEVTRLAREVGTDGILGGQAEVKGVSGTWKELTENVNAMAGNLTEQVRNIAEVTTAVAQGDFSKMITVDARGEVEDLKNTINIMVEQLSSFASEVTRVAKQVGTEGVLGGQADVAGVAGTWKELTENVNAMANNLTNQVRNIAEVTTAVANGDLTRKITVDAKGEILDLKNTTNIMVDQLNSFSSEVTRVAKQVGTDGVLGGQAEVKGVSGTWKELTENVNAMADNLTNQVRNIAEVTTAVANGDLSRKITVDARGEVLDLKDTINNMVDQLNSFSSEVTRVARDVGIEGILGGQAEVEGAVGIWKDLTDNVNSMASNLTNQVRNIAEVTTAVANGDLNKKITVDAKGEILDLKNTINIMVDQLNSFSSEVTRVAKQVGTDGVLGGQAEVKGASGIWKDLADNVNLMAGNLTEQVRNIAEVTTAVANGDLTKKITVDARGEILDLKNTINTMVDQLNSFSSEVTRVATEVGTEGVLGGQADVKGVSGTWKDLTESVNGMARNLTEQVRGIAKVVTAVAKGDLEQKLQLMAKGESATLAETINEMVSTLSIFAEQVTLVAREVGTEGKLGGQAEVPGAYGIWRDLTDNVNQLAANLTTQVRAIANVATAVTKGDLTQSIKVEVLGELSDLKDNMNEMISTLRDTTKINSEQDWLKTNLARFSSMLQGQKDLEVVAKTILSELAPLIKAQLGIFYTLDIEGESQTLKLLSSFAFKKRKNLSNRFQLGEGLVGQAALEKQRILITEAPEDYIHITSGLGERRPVNIVVLPILFEEETQAVLELASFEEFSEITLTFLEQFTESLGIVLNSIAANQRTESLLTQSQTLTERLQTQQEELQQTNEELEEKAKQLSDQKLEVEKKNREVEQTKTEIEKKAEQLALTSKYKSEFLANMSHELRTPLNSIMLLSRLLNDNEENTLTDKQVQQAGNIQSSGSELLNLINDVLDLSKIESGSMEVEISEIKLAYLKNYLTRNFSENAKQKGLEFKVNLDKSLPKTIATDNKRLQQILKNLLSNAMKFTEKGQVEFKAYPAEKGWSITNEILNRSKNVIAFAVTDTGIGIEPDKQNLIFEAFQQVDGTISRKFGGTGLGLSISRELAALLGGEIQVSSIPGKGSTFTFYFPAEYPGAQVQKTSSDAAPIIGTPAPAPSVAVDRNVTFQTVVADDRDAVKPGDQVILIIEDDIKFAGALVDIVHQKEFKALAAFDGESGLAMAEKYLPSAVLLDIMLPGITGWTVLDYLKHNSATRHIPVHIISVEKEPARALKMGAFAYLEKPANKDDILAALDKIRDFNKKAMKNLLVVEDNRTERESIINLIGNGDVKAVGVGSGKEALAELKSKHYDCMVLDLGLPDMDGFKLIDMIKSEPDLENLPVIVYTGKELGPKDEMRLRKLAKTIILKDAQSPERLLEETTLFLHRVEENLPEKKREMLKKIYKKDPLLKGRNILIVDDDMRNIFAMTSSLEKYQMNVQYAENGREGIEMLKKSKNIELVLMDIMMPEMDGYEAMTEIRKIRKYKKLPIIALTAKAMKGDREKCMAAGASDYITKPVDMGQLVSLLRVWLYR